jgi:hypothetical protein
MVTWPLTWQSPGVVTSSLYVVVVIGLATGFDTEELFNDVAGDHL